MVGHLGPANCLPVFKQHVHQFNWHDAIRFAGGGGGRELNLSIRESQSFNNSIIIRLPQAALATH